MVGRKLGLTASFPVFAIIPIHVNLYIRRSLFFIVILEGENNAVRSYLFS